MEKKETYTQWAIKYPWHVSGEECFKYPHDENNKCTCTCKGCTEMYEHNATREAHCK